MRSSLHSSTFNFWVAPLSILAISLFLQSCSDKGKRKEERDIYHGESEYEAWSRSVVIEFNNERESLAGAPNGGGVCFARDVVLTNYHVLDEFVSNSELFSKVTVTSAENVKARVIGANISLAHTDIAFLKTDVEICPDGKPKVAESFLLTSSNSLINFSKPKGQRQLNRHVVKFERQYQLSEDPGGIDWIPLSSNVFDANNSEDFRQGTPLLGPGSSGSGFFYDGYLVGVVFAGNSFATTALNSQLLLNVDVSDLTFYALTPGSNSVPGEILFEVKNRLQVPVDKRNIPLNFVSLSPNVRNSTARCPELSQMTSRITSSFEYASPDGENLKARRYIFIGASEHEGDFAFDVLTNSPVSPGNISYQSNKVVSARYFTSKDEAGNFSSMSSCKE